MLQQHFSNVIQLLNEKEQTYFICLINLKNRHHFLACELDVVPCYPMEQFVNLFTKSKYKLLQKLESRSLEGFIISNNSNLFFKWKYPFDIRLKHYYLLQELKTQFITENELKVFSVFESLCNYGKQFILDLDKKRFDELFEIEMYSKNLIYDDLAKSNNVKFTILCWTNEIFARICYNLKPSEDFLFDKRVTMEIEDLISKKLNHIIDHCL